MKLVYILFVLLVLAPDVLGQTNNAGKLFIPFLDYESQSNVEIIVSDVFGHGEASSIGLTNKLSNTNLFQPLERKTIEYALAIYTKISTNSGPPGTSLVDFHRTNILNGNLTGRKIGDGQWISKFQYTNFSAIEEVVFGSGSLFAKYRDKSNNGYNVHIGRFGSGSSCRFMEIKNGQPNGVLADFRDNHPQGAFWDHKLANFADEHLVEYRHYSNGLVFGDVLLWNKSGNVLLQAKFKTPYEFENHRTELQFQNR